jgi:hypothetical protein
MEVEVDYSASSSLNPSFSNSVRHHDRFVSNLCHSTHFDYSAMSVQQWVTPLEGLDSLRQTEAPMPAPGPGQVLVEVHAVSLNYRDVEGGCSSLNSVFGGSEESAS